MGVNEWTEWDAISCVKFDVKAAARRYHLLSIDHSKNFSSISIRISINTLLYSIASSVSLIWPRCILSSRRSYQWNWDVIDWDGTDKRTTKINLNNKDKFHRGHSNNKFYFYNSSDLGEFYLYCLINFYCSDQENLVFCDFFLYSLNHWRTIESLNVIETRYFEKRWWPSNRIRIHDAIVNFNSVHLP